jgi:DNA-binding response OmpR family regulator
VLEYGIVHLSLAVQKVRKTVGPKILVIDDETTILSALQIFLEQEGYQVEAISKYQGYLEGLNKSELPDLIILDILLMEEDGREVAKKLKGSTKTKHIPIIMISAHPTADKTARRAGADEFLAKPFEVDTLLEAIDRLCLPRKTAVKR